MRNFVVFLIGLLLQQQRASSVPASVDLETPVLVGARKDGHFWFPNTLTSLADGTLFLRVSVHSDGEQPLAQ